MILLCFYDTFIRPMADNGISSQHPPPQLCHPLEMLSRMTSVFDNKGLATIPLNSHQNVIYFLIVASSDTYLLLHICSCIFAYANACFSKEMFGMSGQGISTLVTL